MAELGGMQFPLHAFLFFYHFYHFRYNISITASVMRFEQNSWMFLLLKIELPSVSLVVQLLKRSLIKFKRGRPRFNSWLMQTIFKKPVSEYYPPSCFLA